jgi:hypothetical protein
MSENSVSVMKRSFLRAKSRCFLLSLDVSDTAATMASYGMQIQYLQHAANKQNMDRFE